MSNLNDLWVSYLKGQGYTSNSLPDLMREALADQASSSSKNINDLWRAFLASKGYTGSISQALYDYLGSLGYSGNVNDRLVQSLTAEDFFGSAAPSYAYRLNASEAFISANSPGAEKMVPSADEQTGTTTLTFTGSFRRIFLVGNIETEQPLAINYLNDMSYGNGDFVYELHIDWPALTGATVTGTISAFNQLTSGAAFLQMGSTLGPVDSSTILTARIWDDVGEGVKKYSVWKDGAVVVDGLVIGVDIATGINLSQLFAAMYTEEWASTLGTESEFVDPSPQIITRLVTDPAEMVYAQTVLPQTAQTIVGNGLVEV